MVTEFTVPRSKWCMEWLNNPNGTKMCVMGHYFSACGINIPPRTIFLGELDTKLNNLNKVPKWAIKFNSLDNFSKESYYNTTVVDKIIDVNDRDLDDNLSAKEQLLIDLFAEQGVTLKFTD